MNPARRPQTVDERRLLRGYVSWSTYLFRIGFWLLLAPWLLLVAVEWLFGLVDFDVWLANLFGVPHDPGQSRFSIAVGTWLYCGYHFVKDERFRLRIWRDLRDGDVEERHYPVREAVLFPAAGDEGPVVFFRNDDGVFRLSGQEFAPLETVVRAEIVQVVAIRSNYVLAAYAGGAGLDALVAAAPFHRTPLAARTPTPSEPISRETRLSWEEIVATARRVAKPVPFPPTVRRSLDVVMDFAPVEEGAWEEKIAQIANAALGVMADHTASPRDRDRLTALRAGAAMFQIEDCGDDYFQVDFCLPADPPPPPGPALQVAAYVNDTRTILIFQVLEAGTGLFAERWQISPEFSFDQDITKLRFFELAES